MMNIDDLLDESRPATADSDSTPSADHAAVEAHSRDSPIRRLRAMGGLQSLMGAERETPSPASAEDAEGEMVEGQRLGDEETTDEAPATDQPPPSAGIPAPAEATPGSDGETAAEPACATMPDDGIASPPPQAPARKRGQRKPNYNDEDSARVLKIAKSLIRTDWAGRDPDEVIRQKAAKAKLDLGPLTRDFVRRIAEGQVEGCRERITPRLDESIRRIEGEKPQEVLP